MNSRWCSPLFKRNTRAWSFLLAAPPSSSVGGGCSSTLFSTLQRSEGHARCFSQTRRLQELKRFHRTIASEMRFKKVLKLSSSLEWKSLKRRVLSHHVLWRKEDTVVSSQPQFKKRLKPHCSASKSLKLHSFVFKVGKKKKVIKSTSVLQRVWSNEKTTLQKPNFSKTPKFALKPSKLPEGPLWANLRRRVLSHHIYSFKERRHGGFSQTPFKKRFQASNARKTLKKLETQSCIENSVSCLTKRNVLHQNRSKFKFLSSKLAQTHFLMDINFLDTFVSKRVQSVARNLGLRRKWAHFQEEESK